MAASKNLEGLASKCFTSSLAPCDILLSFPHPPLYSLPSSHLLLCHLILLISYLVSSYLILSYFRLSYFVLLLRFISASTILFYLIYLILPYPVLSSRVYLSFDYVLYLIAYFSLAGLLFLLSYLVLSHLILSHLGAPPIPQFRLRSQAIRFGTP